jgi:TonB family protein
VLGEKPSRRSETERSSALTIVPQRRLRPLGRGSSSGGIIATVAVHAGLVALIYFAHVHSPPAVEVPRDFLVTRLVSLGKPPVKSRLPRIVRPPMPEAPPRVLKVTHNAEAAPAPKEPPPPKDVELSKDVAPNRPARPRDTELAKDVLRALERAQTLAQSPDDTPLGSLTGSPAGTAAQGTTGDAYATAIYTAIRRNWNTPVGLIPDAELAKLVADIRLSILGDGTLAHPEVQKSSGNQYFDDSCLQAIRDTRQVPPPPASMRARFERGTLLEFTGEDMARRGDA